MLNYHLANKTSENKNSIYFLIILALFLLANNMNSTKTLQAQGEQDTSWLLSYYVPGNLTLQPDPSLSQWMKAKAVQFSSLDGSNMTMMSVNNSTYVVFLVNSTVSVPNGLGALIAFDGAGVNGSDDIWAIFNGKQLTKLDPTVKTRSSINHGEFTVSFGRELERGNFILKVGSQYPGFVKATFWNNGTSLDSINTSNLKQWDFELLPPIDEYPKIPIGVTVALFVVTGLFIVYEKRRQSH